ncbi:MAG: hypothetical protein U1E49_10265 [Hyphomicrobiaceae bacterium]
MHRPDLANAARSRAIRNLPLLPSLKVGGDDSIPVDHQVRFFERAD